VLVPRRSGLSEAGAGEQDLRRRWRVERILAGVSSESGYQLVVFSGEEVRAFDLPPAGEVTIGRDETSTVRIEDPSVSRRHALLRIGATLEIEDLGGPNGTFVRQAAHQESGADTLDVNVRQLLGRRASLAVGDCLLFGTACVVLRHPPRLQLPDLATTEVTEAQSGPGWWFGIRPCELSTPTRRGWRAPTSASSSWAGRASGKRS
jgi:hypothetical protein